MFLALLCQECFPSGFSCSCGLAEAELQPLGVMLERWLVMSKMKHGLLNFSKRVQKLFLVCLFFLFLWDFFSLEEQKSLFSHENSFTFKKRDVATRVGMGWLLMGRSL